jgi:fermentation-respiration switch protein FrsA (DUF1100 family)
MSGVKEGSIARFAERFAEAGFNTLAYDHIYFGDSGGHPRQEADPQAQRRGYRDAISFLRARPDIDPNGIGIWGTSYSGGHVLEVAAHDRRVQCVVSQIGTVNGLEQAYRRTPMAERVRLLRHLESDREARFRGEPPAMLKAVSDTFGEACVMAGERAYAYFMSQARDAPRWRNQVTLQTLDMLRGLQNAAFTPYISPTPLLMIVALQDELVPPDLSLAAFEAALQPKRLVLLNNDHFSPYQEEFERCVSEALAWFREHLSAPRSPSP